MHVALLVALLLGLAVLRRALSARTLGHVTVGGLSVEVVEARGRRAMIARRDMCWSEVDRRGRSLLAYVGALVDAVEPEHRRVLFVGCGGGVGPRALVEARPGVAVEVVEPFVAVTGLARRFFGLPASVPVHAATGGAFLAATAERWDAILVDAYGSGDLAEELGARAFFVDARAALAGGGVFAVNVVSDGEDAPLATVLAHVREVFGEATLVDLEPGARHARNFVVRARA